MSLRHICSLMKAISWKHIRIEEINRKFLKNTNLFVDLFILKYLLFSLFLSNNNFFIYLYINE